MNQDIKIGIISDVKHESSPAYSSYYHACSNLFKNVRLVNNVNDLDGIDVLVCGNDHFKNHLDVWSDDKMINYCNEKNIPFFVHTVEHIHTKYYPNNLDIQRKLEKYKILNQRCWDIQDAILKNRSIARVLLSKNFLNYKKPETKKDGIIFIGKIYDNRRNLINELSKHIEVETIERGQFDYFEFLSKLAEYKYILSPKSLLVNGIPGRFYESLWVDSIPLQEIYDNTLDYYDIEKNVSNAIFFKTSDELIEKIKTEKLEVSEQPKMFLEDELSNFFKEYNIKTT